MIALALSMLLAGGWCAPVTDGDEATSCSILPGGTTAQCGTQRFSLANLQGASTPYVIASLMTRLTTTPSYFYYRDNVRGFLYLAQVVSGGLDASTTVTGLKCTLPFGGYAACTCMQDLRSTHVLQAAQLNINTGECVGLGQSPISSASFNENPDLLNTIFLNGQNSAYVCNDWPCVNAMPGESSLTGMWAHAAQVDRDGHHLRHHRRSQRPRCVAIEQHLCSFSLTRP